MRDSSSTFNDMFHSLSQILPGFPVNPSSIEILQSPRHFYETLLNEIEVSKERISISSLYLGTGELEQDLVDKLHSKLSSTDKLETNFVFDYHRAQRIDSSNASSLTVLDKILSDASVRNRFQLCLYRCPQYRSYHDLCLGMRWKEIIGVQHTKLYVFDDTVIISGANLSHSYFVNRSDRYYKLKDRQLADYLHALISKIGRASFLYDHTSKSLQAPISSLRPESFRHCFNFPTKALENPKGTWVFLAMQLGIAGIYQDELALFSVLRACDSSRASVTFASGYLNMTPKLQKCLIDLKANINILTASPSANGFYNAKGVARHIPNVYSFIQAQTLDLNKFQGRITMAEYDRPGWTYHEKGIWIGPDKDQPPLLTTIGSSNFGYRSARRDLECQLYILSSESTFRKRLGNEVSDSMRYVSPVTAETFQRAPGRRPSFGIRLVSRLIKTWL